MSVLILAVFGFVLIQSLVCLIWWRAYQIQKTSIVDIFWSLMILAAVIFYFFFLTPHRAFHLVCLFLASFWAIRLSLHIYFRGRGHGEEPRYQALRKQWGTQEKKKMFVFFIQQGVAAWVFSIPFLILFANDRPAFGIWEIIGVLIWVIAFNGEAISDAQLLTFKSDPANKGRVCRMGLWKYSRHPNYFFEWLNWVAFAWLALPQTYGHLAVICPMLMYYFLNRVSGVPLAEKQALKTRSLDYAEYQRVTSPFFPWIPKKSSLFK